MNRTLEGSSIYARQSEVLVHDDKTTILDEIVKDLTEPNMIIFGVYGTSISNKINLVAQINKRVERDSLFDAVVTASQITNIDMEGIQEELGHQLSLQLNKITTDFKKKARLLCDKIKTKEKILIILVLNDLKGRIDLGEIGIPFGDDHKGSKILLIAQTRELLSHQMKTRKEYSIDNHEPDEEPGVIIMEGDSIQYLNLFIWEPRVGASASMCSVDSESMKTELNEIMMALTQPNMRIVGVYGSSKARKRVVEQITRRLERDGMFDVVVHVMASTRKKNAWLPCGKSESPDVKKIQEELAKKLGAQLHDKASLVEGATTVCDTIKTMGDILIIVDDLKGGIDLPQLGIPFGNYHLPSKILLLAQTQGVLSNQINAPQTKFYVHD